MSYLDLRAVATTCGLAKTVVSFGTMESSRLSESAWLRIAVSSDNLAICAALRAICAEDNSSRGLGSELAVPTALLRVFERIVWLAERLVIIKMPTANNNMTLPVIIPQRIQRRLVLLSRAFGLYN